MYNKKAVQGSVCVIYEHCISYHYLLIYNKSYFSVFGFDIKFNNYTAFVATFTVTVYYLPFEKENGRIRNKIGSFKYDLNYSVSWLLRFLSLKDRYSITVTFYLLFSIGIGFNLNLCKYEFNHP